MGMPYTRAPHSEGTPGPSSGPHAPNAALLIDFDNVTMGMRSDLSKELRNLLNSDIIKGKVTVQRAYADWRRYPQYIVPLSENSVDLIFAPAYGSSKKNATDIRMAIDAIELVFIRPEIGTFILLTGDSDFSSVVLKLKEYGKYVIGVGIQESSSDILVQNCDEYYSYTSLTGLRKTTDSDNKPVDPWVLVEQAAARMASRNDVMRSDRLKQVMIEIDPSFDEGNFGFSKFSRFLSEAGSRDLVGLRKLENGQYEVLPSRGGPRDTGGASKDDARKPSGRGRPRGKDKDDRVAQGRTGTKPKPEARAEADRPKGSGREAGKSTAEEKKPEEPTKDVGPVGGGDGASPKGGDDPLRSAYGALRDALAKLTGGERESVRDSDLKRKMLQLDPTFDEGDLGFGKFSRFLRQAHDHEIVDLEKGEGGTYRVSPKSEVPKKEPEEAATDAPVQAEKTPPSEEKPAQEKPPQEKEAAVPPIRGGVGVRRGDTRGRKGMDGPPPLLEGQVVGTSITSIPPGEAQSTVEEEIERERTPVATRTPRGRRGAPRDRVQGDQVASIETSGEALDIGALGLPTDGPALIRYLTNSYKGVGEKTAQRLVNEFGAGLFEVLHRDPKRLESVIRADRVGQLLEGWKADLGRRLERRAGETQGQGTGTTESAPPARPRTRKSTRGRGRGGGGKSEKEPS